MRNAVSRGRLPAIGKRIDAALVGSPWRLGNIKKIEDSLRTPHPGETIEAAATRIAASERVIPPYSESLARREYFVSLIKELEYAVKAKEVCNVGEVAQIVGEQLATVRTRLLALPSEQAPRMTRLKTAAEVEAALREVIVGALTELVGHVAH